MRKTFKTELYQRMKEDKDIFVLVGDLGYGMFDDIKRDFPDRFINCGASEQAMMGMAVGLTYKGKKVFVYSITNFVLYRPFEVIRNYLAYEQAPVHIIAAGRDKDYAHDGVSHWSEDAKAVLEALNHSTSGNNCLKTYFPDQNEEISTILDEILASNQPSFLSLRR